MEIGEPRRIHTDEPDLVPVVLPAEQPVRVDWPLEDPIPVVLPAPVEVPAK
jgi:hypothetical protein